MMMTLRKINTSGEMQPLPSVKLVRAKRESTAQPNEGKRFGVLHFYAFLSRAISRAAPQLKGCKRLGEMW